MSEQMKDLLPSATAPVVTLKKMLEAGVHFGHQTKRWNPKMGKYIYTSRNGIYIVDLNKTQQKIEEAYAALKAIVANSGKVLFVGTKKQSQEIVREQAIRSGSFYATARWLGGTLTNFKTIQKRIKYLQQLEEQINDGSLDAYPKKEAAGLRKEFEKLEKTLGGIKEMRKLPNAVFITDPTSDLNAIHEARKLGIPVFGLVDTNSDPDLLDFPIPSNDDAVRSVNLLVSIVADAVVEAKGGQVLVAYQPDEGDAATMTDAVKNVEEKQAEQRRLRQQNAARRPSYGKYRRNDRPTSSETSTPSEEKSTEAVETSSAE